jgi:hypothetical protein
MQSDISCHAMFYRFNGLVYRMHIATSLPTLSTAAVPNVITGPTIDIVEVEHGRIHKVAVPN